jgi:hypothetical protein
LFLETISQTSSSDAGINNFLIENARIARVFDFSTGYYCPDIFGQRKVSFIERKRRRKKEERKTIYPEYLQRVVLFSEEIAFRLLIIHESNGKSW